MDPITTAIVTAVSAGAAGGVVKEAVIDAYKGLKAVIKRKFTGELPAAIEKLESRPDSKARQDVVAEEVRIIDADKDPETLEAARKLIELIKASPGGDKHVMIAKGMGIAQADRNSTAKVEIKRSGD